MDKVRDTKLDFLKGFCILCVVLGHVIKVFYAPQTYDENILFRLCYSFHMPLFIFISGYLLGIKKREGFNLKWLGNRVIRLLVPVLVWSLINSYSFADAFFFNLPFWFLNILFLCNMIHFIAVKLNHKYIFSFLLYLPFIILLYFFGNVSVLVKNMIFFFPFYVAGVFVRENKEKLFSFFSLLLNLSLVVYPVLFCFYVYQDYGTAIYKIQSFFHIQNYGSIIHLFLYANNHVFAPLAGIGFWWKISNLIFKITKINILKNIISFIGLYTMQIYLMHGIMFRVYSQNVMMNSLLVFFLSILIPVTTGVVFKFLNKHCKYVKPVSMILFGQ